MIILYDNIVYCVYKLYYDLPSELKVQLRRLKSRSCILEYLEISSRQKMKVIFLNDTQYIFFNNGAPC